MVKIYFGCGLDKRAGYINVDIRKDVNPDVVWNLEVTPYPFQTESAEEILFKDSLEHISWRKIPDVIAECRRILRKGGRLLIQAPDMEEIARRVIFDMNNDWKAISFWVYGEQDYPENLHKSGFTIPSITRLLEENGFKVVKAVRDGGTNMIIEAVKK